MNKVNQLDYVPQSDANQTSRKLLEEQINLVEAEAEKYIKEKIKEIAGEEIEAVKRAAVELMLTTGEMALEGVGKFISAHKEEILKAGKFIANVSKSAEEGLYNVGKYAAKGLYTVGKPIATGLGYAGKFAAKYAGAGLYYTGKYAAIGAYYAGKYTAIGAYEAGKFVYKNVAKPVGQFVYDNGEYIYKGVKTLATGAYQIGKYVITSEPTKYLATHGLKLAIDAGKFALEHKEMTVGLYKLIKGNYNEFGNIKKDVQNMWAVRKEKKKTKFYDAIDTVAINKAKEKQTYAESKLVEKGKTRNAFMVNKGAFYLQSRYFDEIVGSVQKIAENGAVLLGEVGETTSKSFSFVAKEVVKLISHYLSDAGALKDFYKGPGKMIANNIKDAMYNSQGDKNKKLADRFKNVTDNMDELKMIRLAQGYENEKEHAEALGLNIVHSLLYSTSDFNTNIANRRLATVVLKSLGLESLAGKNDEASARKLYSALLTA